jgi:hypothetical protein
MRTCLTSGGTLLKEGMTLTRKKDAEVEEKIDIRMMLNLECSVVLDVCITKHCLTLLRISKLDAPGGSIKGPEKVCSKMSGRTSQATYRSC